jgi:hypothetical protein
MKPEHFQLRGNNSVCNGALQLRRGPAPVKLTGNIAAKSCLKLTNYSFLNYLISSFLFNHLNYSALRVIARAPEY